MEEVAQADLLLHVVDASHPQADEQIGAVNVVLAEIGAADKPTVMVFQAAALGAMVFSYFNDSYFWVVNRLLGIDDVKDQVRVWSVPTTIGWAISGALVTVLSCVVPA